MVKGDVLIGLSTSGNSENVYRALKKAREIGCLTIAFLGMKGKIAEVADIVLNVNSDDTPRIQEVHLTAGHFICEIVEGKLYDLEKSGQLQKDKIMVPWFPNYF